MHGGEDLHIFVFYTTIVISTEIIGIQRFRNIPIFQITDVEELLVANTDTFQFESYK